MSTEAIPVHVYFLLDRTGSMAAIADDVIGGFNTFLTNQQAKPGECVMTLVQFDSEGPFEILHDAVPLDQVQPLTVETYVPRGGTPLLDAEGRLIVRAEVRAADRKEAGKPVEAVIFVTYTDGRENASREWTFDALSRRKALHEGDWAFLYLGVGHDAYKQSSAVGTMSVNTYSGDRDAAGAAAAMDYMVCEVDNTRERAAAGMKTGSHQTRSAQVAAESRPE